MKHIFNRTINFFGLRKQSGFIHTSERDAFGVNFAKAERGFTLIEMVLSIAIFSLISVGVISLVSNLFTASNQQSGLLADEDAARRLVIQMVNEMRNMQTGSDGSYPLALANAQEVVFFAPVQGQPGISRVHYFVQNGALKKGTVQFANSAYNTASETVVTITKNVANTSQALFSYYDDTYAGQSNQAPLSQPVNVTQVNFIKMNLQIFNKAGVQNTAFYTVTAGATMRNLKTNLGQ